VVRAWREARQGREFNPYQQLKGAVVGCSDQRLSVLEFQSSSSALAVGGVVGEMATATNVFID